MTVVLQILLIVTSLMLIGMILLHKGKGGGMSDMFGGGISGSLGGSSVAEKNLDRITIVIGLVWFASIVGLGLLIGSQVGDGTGLTPPPASQGAPAPSSPTS